MVEGQNTQKVVAWFDIDQFEGGMDILWIVLGSIFLIVGIIGCIQATEVIKVLSGFGRPLFGRLLLLDATTMEWRSLKLPADPACPVCGSGG